ncbi:AAA family ATPase [Streptomyces sp. 150FB]|uniref:AAA family ATPase n=1 Tax=Streptomyces sp. 150FB TaxID=1576605 RepID=UPI001567DFCB|nr:AAA family ATPase [Streptomyces sp. 150FB]
MPDHPRFESLEGLRGTGKSTIAPMLAASRDAVLVPTMPPLYEPLRREMDTRANVDARMCFYLSALLTAVDQIRSHLIAGNPVVVESYFARCFANHRAFGAGIDVELPAEVPQPTTYYLVCAENERRRRLAHRNKPVSRWDVLAEDAAEQITRAYAQFPMHRVDTTGLTPGEVCRTILATDMQGAHRRANAEPVGTHPYLLPSVPCRS